MSEPKVEKAKEMHRKSGPYKTAADAIKSKTFGAVHKAIKNSAHKALDSKKGEKKGTKDSSKGKWWDTGTKDRTGERDHS